MVFQDYALFYHLNSTPITQHSAFNMGKMMRGEESIILKVDDEAQVVIGDRIVAATVHGRC